MIQQLVWTCLMLSAPMLVSALTVGLIISIFQAVTQIQESTLSFVPRLLAALLITVITAPWMIGTMVDYTGNIFKTMVVVSKKRH